MYRLSGARMGTRNPMAGFALHFTPKWIPLQSRIKIPGEEGWPNDSTGQGSRLGDPFPLEVQTLPSPWCLAPLRGNSRGGGRDGVLGEKPDPVCRAQKLPRKYKNVRVCMTSGLSDV